jgi:RNA polymerase sigma-70 factor (ECF subfamily)
MKSPEPTSQGQEKAWVLRAQQGDAAAFRCLVDTYDRRLLYFVLRFLPDADRALDVMQDVWLTLFRRLPSLRAPEAFRVWLYQIAHDKVVDLVRRHRREERAHAALRAAHGQGHALGGASSNGQEQEAAVEHAELVHHALGALSPEHRAVLLFRFLEGLSLEEVATALRCNLGTVKSRLHYAKAALRREVERLEHE